MEHARQRECSIADQRLGILAHELRNLLNTATLAFESMKGGRVAAGDSTGLVLGRNLMDCAISSIARADVRLDAGIKHFENISMATLT